MAVFNYVSDLFFELLVEEERYADWSVRDEIAERVALLPLSLRISNDIQVRSWGK
ncbi:hypothetical protein OAV88_00090 [bacterium]|nr:hypothetical protein [bacterium]